MDFKDLLEGLKDFTLGNKIQAGSDAENAYWDTDADLTPEQEDMFFNEDYNGVMPSLSDERSGGLFSSLTGYGNTEDATNGFDFKGALSTLGDITNIGSSIFKGITGYKALGMYGDASKNAMEMGDRNLYNTAQAHNMNVDSLARGRGYSQEGRDNFVKQWGVDGSPVYSS